MDVTTSSSSNGKSVNSVLDHIVTTGPPVAERHRRLTGEKLISTRAELDYILEQGICRRSSSPRASPLHLISKKRGSWKVCGDYRKLNVKTVPYSYPIAHIHDLADRLHGKTILTTPDLVPAYHHIPMAEEDIPKTAVSTPFEIFEFVVMAFGLRNATQSFQRFIDTIFRDLDVVCCYIDDIIIIIISKSPDLHREDLRILLSRLQQYRLSINISQCCFGQKDVQYLGYTNKNDGCKPSTERVAVIMNYIKKQIPLSTSDASWASSTTISNAYRSLPNIQLLSTNFFVS
jgi:hypothetical protein